MQPPHEVIPGVWQGGLPYGPLPEGTRSLCSLVRCLTPPSVDAHLSLPIEDGVDPGLDWLRDAVPLVDRLARRGGLYIHCRLGISRSVMLTAAWLVWRKNLGVAEALAKLPWGRPAPVFLELLSRWEEYAHVPRG